MSDKTKLLTKPRLLVLFIVIVIIIIVILLSTEDQIQPYVGIYDQSQFLKKIENEIDPLSPTKEELKDWKNKVNNR